MLDRATVRALAMVSGLGFAIALPLGLLLLGGLWLDERLGTKPLFMLLGILAGLIVAGLTIWELLAFQRGGGGRLIRRRRGRDASTSRTETDDAKEG